jgi:hypothetical protein
MFPWSPEFVWDAGHLAFFGALYGVLVVVGVVLALALRRARAGDPERRGERLAWRAAFEELPRRDRACRHALTGEAPGRVCDNAFECGTCATHPTLCRERGAASGTVAVAGLRMPADRLYHRGHAWVKPEEDGTVTVGLDDMARRLVGAPDAVVPPSPGERVVHGGPALRLRTRGGEIRVLSPVEGVVLGTEGAGLDAVLRVDPARPFASAHLISGDEVEPWMVRELGRATWAAPWPTAASW